MTAEELITRIQYNLSNAGLKCGGCIADEVEKILLDLKALATYIPNSKEQQDGK